MEITVLMVDWIEELDCWLLREVPALARLLVRIELGLLWCLLGWLGWLGLLWWLVLKLLSRNIMGGPRPLAIHQCETSL